MALTSTRHFSEGQRGHSCQPCTDQNFAFDFKDSLNKNSSSVLEMETLHLDVSLVYTCPLSAPANTVRHMTTLISRDFCPTWYLSGSQAWETCYLPSPSSACTRAGSCSIPIRDLCVCLCHGVLLGSPAYKGPAQCSSVLHSEEREKHEGKFIKLKNK